jgi:asparagine synthase (glutamine-hydrolysing)
VSVVVAAAGATGLDPDTRNWVSAATAYARFAGPDGDETMFGERWGAGHALLRLAHEHASQPLTLGDGVWLSADARLDDRAALRTALRSAGHAPPEGADDAELLLHGYAAWGEGLLNRIAGDFAFALWDDRRQQLICACDQVGVVPLHYTRLGGQLLVASSPDLLLLHPGVSDALDDDALADFLLFGNANSFGTTSFAAIRRLPPAHVLNWSDGHVKLRRYWEAPEFEPLLRLRERSDYVEHFRDVLERAVGDRIDSGPLTSHLSGGMDSTTVTALAQRLRAGRGSTDELRAITLVLGGKSGDEEGHYAALVAEALGIETDLIDESKLGSTDPLAPPKLLTPEPTAYPWSDIEYLRIAVAADHARTCLTGLGADPLLGFVPWYWAEWLARGEVRRLVVTYRDQARLFAQRPQPHLRTTLRRVAATRQAVNPSAPSWMDDTFATATDAAGRLRAVTPPPSWTWDKRSLTRLPVWQNWFTWADPSYTRLPLRLRHPLADIRLLDFVARIPPYPWLVDKQILRDATRDVLPKAVVQRRKTLLVDAPRPSATPEARQALAELISSVPAAGQFLDTKSLRDAVLSTSAGGWQEWPLTRPLGLVYWLAHRKRPGI